MTEAECNGPLTGAADDLNSDIALITVDGEAASEKKEKYTISSQ